MQTLSATITAVINPKFLTALLWAAATITLLLISFTLISSAQASGAGGSVEVDGAYLTEELSGAEQSEAEAIRKILDF